MLACSEVKDAVIASHIDKYVFKTSPGGLSNMYLHNKLPITIFWSTCYTNVCIDD